MVDRDEEAAEAVEEDSAGGAADEEVAAEVVVAEVDQVVDLASRDGKQGGFERCKSHNACTIAL